MPIREPSAEILYEFLERLEREADRHEELLPWASRQDVVRRRLNRAAEILMEMVIAEENA